MMKDQTKAAEILNNLIKANNNHIAGYKQAIMDAKGIHNYILPILEARVSESTEYKQELIQKIKQLGNDVKDNPGDSQPGIWMDIKTAFISNDTKSIFKTCEHYENSILHTYEKVLSTKEEISEDILQLIANQKEKINESYDLIKKHVDMVAF